jgi:glycosyltransferase involved in cell wall biosynthesis
LTKALDQLGVSVDFVLPTSLPHDATSHVTFRTSATLTKEAAQWGYTEYTPEDIKSFTHTKMIVLPAVLQAYASPTTGSYTSHLKRLGKAAQKIKGGAIMTKAGPVAVGQPTGQLMPAANPGQYRGDLMGQVRRYAMLAVQLSNNAQFDVIHAHDWMTYSAGLAVAAVTGKPLVVHVHSTEFDRSGEHVNQQVYDIERAGMHGADKVVCVSYLTRNIVISRYGVPPEKVDVVYNAVEDPGSSPEFDIAPIRRDERIVLFLGRLTMQKGPEYFLMAAKKVLDKYKKVRFIIAGSGDLVSKSIELSAALGIGRYVTFTGFLRGDDVAKIFRMADLYVMPSVSEPFGIAPLEALSHNVPVIISKQSGVSEVLTHVLKVDFWDTDEMANKILAVLRHPPLQRVLRQQGQIELRKLSWKDSADKCRKIYEEVVAGA